MLRPHAAGPFHRVSHTHWLHDGFVFPILFPNPQRTPGWHPQLRLPNGVRAVRTKISMPMFYRWQLIARPKALLQEVAATHDAWPSDTPLALQRDDYTFPFAKGTAVVAGCVNDDIETGCTYVSVVDDRDVPLAGSRWRSVPSAKLQPRHGVAAVELTDDGAWPANTLLELQVQTALAFAKGSAVVSVGVGEGDLAGMTYVKVVDVNTGLLAKGAVQLAVPSTDLQLRVGPCGMANEHLFRAGRLFQQYVATQAARCDVYRAAWIRSPAGQKQIRAEEYGSLVDAAAQGDDLSRVGKAVVCPSSEHGSRRAMAVLFLNCMAMVQRFGRPDLFITVTCNPNHPDILRSLLPGQHPTDRPDLIARYFNRQVHALLEVLTEGQVFGAFEMYSAIIEFQQRNLPHLHLLLRLVKGPRDPSEYDQYVSAEIPPNTDPDLQKTVLDLMTHITHEKVNARLSAGMGAA